ncbi:MAG TPA: PadR family transcriptional regulator [Actinomycetes bacterium]|nr:PadR family transcriptional regulator [Actinomycetes bacterium]
MKHHMHHRGPGGPRGPRFAGGRRGGARRGDVRGAILLLLAERPMHGYQLMQEMSARTDGAWRPSPGAIYPALAQLEDEGLVVVTREGGRKLASLTDAGRAELEANAESIGDPFAELREAGDHGSLRAAFEGLGGAVRQVARTGTATQRGQVERILIDARRAVYLVLADAEPAETTETGAS